MTELTSLSRYKIEGIRKLAHKNIRLLLKKMKFSGEDLGSRIVGCCPNPHSRGQSPNDNPTAFSWDFDRQMWQCFTHRCHNINGADIFALIRTVKNCSFRAALQWVLDSVDTSIDEVKEIDPDEVRRTQEAIRKKSELVKHSQMEDALMTHLKPSSYFKNRGFSQEVIDEFKCGGEWHKSKTYGENRAIVPVYDPLDGYLIAFTCRLLNDDDIETWRPKWCHALNFADIRKKSADRKHEERFHASSVLFNLHRAKAYMGASKSIILVEGPGDVMRMWEAGLKNVVAILGTSFSRHHKTLLHKVGCAHIISALDADEAGGGAHSKVEKMCKNYFQFSRVVLDSGKDPGDYDPSQLRMIFKDYL